MVNFPETLDELLKKNGSKKITSILKRDNRIPVKFDLSAISSAVTKASIASGKNFNEQTALEIAEEVRNGLQTKKIFEYSHGKIPSVEDVQEEVINVFNKRNAKKISESIHEKTSLPSKEIYSGVLDAIEKKNFDPTGDFYFRYKEEREKIRNKIVNLPFSVDFDSTDKQLQIHSVTKGESHKFNATSLKNLILERTNVSYIDAGIAVKNVEKFLTQRKSEELISKEEIISLVDATLMQKGYSANEGLGGRKISLTLDDVDQMIFNKSNENSNIKKNNPEAVNLGIAELALKEKALRDVFDKDVAKAHKNGQIHIHDLGYINRTYCSAHSVEYIKKYGLDVVVTNLDAKSSPAKDVKVLNNHIHTFLAAIQSSYAGALGFPMLNTLYGPAILNEIEMVEGEETIEIADGKNVKIKRRIRRDTLESRIADKDLDIKNFHETGSRKILRRRSKKELKQIAQNLVFGAAQSAFSRGGQTLFIDFNIDLDTPGYVTEVPALFLGNEYKKLKKNEFDEWEIIETSSDEPARYEGLKVDKGHKDAKGEKILELDNKNGDVIQPKDGTVWATYGNEIVRQASRDFAEALFVVAEEGDKYGNMFNFPKFDVHVGRETFEDPESNELLKKACKTVEKNDSIYFMFDRGDGMNVSQCCRLRERITDPAILKHPEKMRFNGFQNVTINLPQCAYRSEGDNLEEKINNVMEEIDKSMLIALKAHVNKKEYIQSYFENEGSPLFSMGGTSSDDGEPYIDLSKSTYIIGIAGLNEAVQDMTGKQLHEDAESYKLGLKLISHMYSVKNEFTQLYGLKFVIEETPGESANRRLAKIDEQKYPEKSKKVLKGNFEADEIYYTNSAHLNADAPISGLDRVVLQSKMNPLIEAGAITHIFSGEKINKANAVYDMVKTTYDNTQSSQIVFSGEHTVCLSCGDHSRGLNDSCGPCGNEDPQKISQKTRVVGYFSDPRSWNKSKKGELKKRRETQKYYSGEMNSLKNLEEEILESVIEPGKTRIAIIGKKDCSVCDGALDKVNSALKRVSKDYGDNLEIVKYDVGTEEGRVMAAIYDSPLDTYPTIVVHKGNKFERKGWEYPYNKPVIGVKIKDIKEMVESIEGK